MTLFHGVSEADMVNKLFIYKEMVHLLSGEFGRGREHNS